MSTVVSYCKYHTFFIDVHTHECLVIIEYKKRLKDVLLCWVIISKTALYIQLYDNHANNRASYFKGNILPKQ